jgi:hypothetical protein
MTVPVVPVLGARVFLEPRANDPVMASTLLDRRSGRRRWAGCRTAMAASGPTSSRPRRRLVSNRRQGRARPAGRP